MVYRPENPKAALDGFTSRVILGKAQVPGLVRWLHRRGIIRTPSQGKLLVVAVVVTNLAVTAILYFRFL